MNVHRLEVPTSKDSKDWFLFIKRSLEYNKKVDKLIVDFNSIFFLETDDFVVLACLIESFYSNDCEVCFTGGTTKFNNHLFNIKFKEYWKPHFDREKFTLSYNQSTLCLWKISNQMYEYSNYARKYFENFTKNKDLLPLSSNMDEVFNNIFDHSQSPVTGYIITQYYPKNNKISFSVCDFGIGIAQSINNHLHEQGLKPVEDWKAILKSLEKGYSIRSTPRNRGFGLNNILELTEDSNGKLTIISNNGVLQKAANEHFRAGPMENHFNGTLIKVEVDLNTFEEKDEIIDLYDFK